MTEWKDLKLTQLEANKDSDQLSRLLDEWAEKIRVVDASLQIVEQAYIEVNKDMTKLKNELSNKRQEQLGLESTIHKATHTKRELSSQLKQIERFFWRSK